MTRECLLSVVIPAFEAERYIAEAIGSVIEQLPPSSEVIVVDDGSSDGTADVAASFGGCVQVIRASHGGSGVAVDRGVAAAKGALLAFVDADDRWLPGKVARSLDVLASSPATEAVFAYVRQFRSADVAATALAVPAEPLPGVVRGTMTIRREAWDRVGPMYNGMYLGEFISWYARAIEVGLKVQMIPEVLYERRIHGANTTVRERAALVPAYHEVVRAALQRRRAAKETT